MIWFKLAILTDATRTKTITHRQAFIIYFKKTKFLCEDMDILLKSIDYCVNFQKEIKLRGDNLLVGLLQNSIPGNLSPEVFEAVARVAVYPAVEFIPLRKNYNKVEVLLFQRPSEDIIWPSMWHTPGTILRPTDETYEDAFTRLMEDELQGTETSLPIFIGAELSKNHRGRCVLLEHLVIVEGEPRAGTFFSVDNLPKDFIADQLPSLNRAVAALERLAKN
jgi:hypothetical protein